MSEIEISNETARRFLLGRSGLWPGRRRSGIEGASQSIHELESLQLDPVVVLARSHDIQLWSRVTEYAPEQLETLQHDQRRFFDYGNHLNLYPMEELRHWRVHMHRHTQDKEWGAWGGANRELIASVRDYVAQTGPTLNRELQGESISRIYRGGKNTSLALYYLWITGELMTARRRRFERYYDLASRIVPAEHDLHASIEEADRFFAIKALRQISIGTLTWWGREYRYFLHRELARKESIATMKSLLDEGVVTPIRVAGGKEQWFIASEDVPLLAIVARGEIPDTWRQVAETTQSEATLLSPLDPVIDRERSEALFGFSYRWEIYVPERLRRYGPYTLPILWRDRIVGRIDLRCDRIVDTMIVNGIWFEEPHNAGDPEFLTALASGLASFVRFHNANRIELSAVQPTKFRTALGKALRGHGLTSQTRVSAGSKIAGSPS